jgi:hypothetical protein
MAVVVELCSGSRKPAARLKLHAAVLLLLLLLLLLLPTSLWYTECNMQCLLRP